MISRSALGAFLFWLAVFVLAHPAGAAGTAGPVDTGQTTARLIADRAQVTPGERFYVALHQRMDPGWHTYWVHSGDSGFATTIDWTAPDTVTMGAIQWPIPHALPYGPLVNYGYEGDAVLLVPVTVSADAEPGDQITLVADAEWLVCADICIPEGTTLTLQLPVGATAVPSADAALIESGRAALPQQSPWPAKWHSTAADDFVLTVSGLDLDPAVTEAVTFFPLAYGLLDHAAEQTLSHGADAVTITVPRAVTVDPEDGIARGVLVIAQRRDGAVLRQGFTLAAQPQDGRELGVPPAIPAAVEDPPAADGGGVPTVGLAAFAVAVLGALVGGLILNLMPCVFPVLSLKAMGLMQKAAADRAAIRTGGLAYTAGVLATFLLLAIVLLALKAGGAHVGWGFQLQSPAVVMGLAYILFALGLSLSGVFSLGGRLMGFGQRLTEGDGLTASFATGALAAIVATPCTAPFMGAALGYGLTQPWPVALAVFLALGLGLALPFLALSLAPGLARMLPRPGAWMTRFRQLLAFPLYLSAVWLIWVLAQQAGGDAAGLAMAGAVALAFAAWAFAASNGAPPRWTIVGRSAGSIAVLLVLASFLALPQMRAEGARAALTTGSTAATTQPGLSEAYSAARLAALRAEGRPVFVNMTAAWCITCLVNERVALNTAETKALFAAQQITYLKGDWTNYDPAITAMLEQHGRSGVPLYLYFPAGAADPVILPQILTVSLVRNAILGDAQG